MVKSQYFVTIDPEILRNFKKIVQENYKKDREILQDFMRAYSKNMKKTEEFIKKNK